MTWSLLCTYLRGAPENLEPLRLYKNAPRHKRVHSFTQVVGLSSVTVPLLFLRTIPKEVSQASLASAKYKLMHLRFGISPRYRLQMYVFFYNSPNKKWKKCIILFNARKYEPINL